MLLVKKIERQSLLLKDVVSCWFSSNTIFMLMLFFLANNTGKIIKVNKVK